ncbi:heterokaryon incompatibility protein-domain-containing protein, partial [Massariosphaeria phaeospora]
MSIASAAGQGAVSESLGGFDISVPEKRYHYQSLSKPTSIRLIELLPGGDKDMLSFEIHEVDLSHNPSYEALSYEWKDKSGTIPVRCHDRRLLVTPNLKAALEKLRLKKKKRTLWIDGICINQADVEERNQQVHLMTDIYRKAEKVLMWLG